MRATSFFRVIIVTLAILFSQTSSRAAVVTFGGADFGLNPTFSNVTTFNFNIRLSGPIAPGGFVNPSLDLVQYNVFGNLAAGTPSGFMAFDLQRTINGGDFYNQGSSLNFEVAAGADLSDGLQVSELVGAGTVFTFNGREVGTGRYHPALVELNANGTGLIRNSNNFGGINPGSGEMVDVQIGEEYVTELTFDPNTLTLAAKAVPEPSTMACCVALAGFFAVRRMRRKRGLADER